MDSITADNWIFEDKLCEQLTTEHFESESLDELVESIPISGTLTIYYPDGSSTVNPSTEEIIEWAKGTQIPIYKIL